MTDPDELETRWLRGMGRLVLYGMVAVVLYVLSIGPAAWLLVRRSVAGDQFISWFYTPLMHACEIPGFRGVLQPYLEWWSVLPGGPDGRSNRRLPQEPGG